MKNPFRPVAIDAVSLALATAACGNAGGRDFTIGFKRVALDLSYQDEKLAAPPTREDVVVPQPVPAQAAFLTQISVPPNLAAPLPPQPLPKQQVGCPKASDDAHPEHPATVFVTEPPAKGLYTTHNSGSISLVGAISVSFKFPSRGIIEIRNIAQTSVDDPINGPTQVITYDEYVPGLDGGGTTTTYRVTYSPATLTGTIGQTAGGSHAPQGELDLVRLQMKSSAGDIDFNPQPPVTIMAFKTGQGTSWNSAGIDPNDGTSMVVQGSVSQRTNIDLCGTVYDTYEVVSNEHIVNLRTGLRSDTSTTDPNVYHVATHYGGLFIQKHVDVTTSFPGKESATPTIVTAVYDQTFDSITPVGSGAG
jgi:hypothetical protein